jgi:steroid delta-isomerase-like uncharacterized protein
MTVEENKALDRRMVEAWDKGNMAVMDELLAPNFVHHSAPPGVTPDREGFKQFASMLHTAFPDFRFTVEDVVAEGDKVATRATCRGTHKGEYMGIAPTGKQVTWTLIFIRRFKGGKIAEQWTESDSLGTMQQLGVVPSSEQGGK